MDRNTRNKGFSLLEVLITLLLTTVGILGMVVLQGKGIRYTQDAVNRNNAVSLTNDLIEIMRQYQDDFWFHKKDGRDQDYDQLKNTTALFKADGSLAVSGQCADTPQTLAEHAACWVQRMENTLPGAGTAAVKNTIRVCPSFALNTDAKGNHTIKCANTNFKGSSMGIQLAWEVRPGECMDGNPTGTVCTYYVRIEL